MGFSGFLLVAIVVFALVGIVSADYRKGRSLKPYKPGGQNSNSPDDDSAIKIQGIVYCNRDGKWTPIQGATGRVTCLALNQRGYESAPFSVVTELTDEKGYFRINLGKYALDSFRLTDCRVFLETSAPGICNVPTDKNYGLSGAPLTTYRTLPDHSALYSVGPFLFDPSPY